MDILYRYKSVSKVDLAKAYGVSIHTFNAWLKPINTILGAYVARRYTPKQVQKIVETLGEPELILIVRD